MQRRKEFLDLIKYAADIIRKHILEGSVFHVYSHLDADGLSAAGIIGAALARQNATFRIRILPWLDREIVDKCATDKADLIIFSDLGSGYLDLIKAKLSKRPVVILDHHPPVGKANQNITHVNPWLFGIDGTREISGAGVTYLTMKALDPRNIASAPMAIVGALGDMQDVYPIRKLGGLNALIVEEAKSNGLIATQKDLIFFGHETRPIHRALARTLSPFIPGITGSEGKSYAFLVGLGLKAKENDKWRTLKDLTMDEKRTLASGLAEYLISRGLYKQVKKLIGEIYTLLKESPNTPLRDGREFSTLLNSTGRMGKYSLGVALAMGARGRVLEEAQAVLDEYRKMIGQYLDWAVSTPGIIEEKNHIYVLHGRETVDTKMIGIITSALVLSIPHALKPLVGYSFLKEKQVAKFSLRTTEEAVQSGIHLGNLIADVAKACGGSGGGHDIAAGAEIPIAQLERAITLLDRTLEVRDKQKNEEKNNRNYNKNDP